MAWRSVSKSFWILLSHSWLYIFDSLESDTTYLYEFSPQKLFLTAEIRFFSHCRLYRDYSFIDYTTADIMKIAFSWAYRWIWRSKEVYRTLYVSHPLQNFLYFIDLFWRFKKRLVVSIWHKDKIKKYNSQISSGK